MVRLNPVVSVRSPKRFPFVLSKESINGVIFILAISFCFSVARHKYSISFSKEGLDSISALEILLVIGILPENPSMVLAKTCSDRLEILSLYFALLPDWISEMYDLASKYCRSLTSPGFVFDENGRMVVQDNSVSRLHSKYNTLRFFIYVLFELGIFWRNNVQSFQVYRFFLELIWMFAFVVPSDVETSSMLHLD